MASRTEDCDYYQIGTQDCRVELGLEALDQSFDWARELDNTSFDWDPEFDITGGSDQLQTVCQGVRHNGLRKLVPWFSLDANLRARNKQTKLALNDRTKQRRVTSERKT